MLGDEVRELSVVESCEPQRTTLTYSYNWNIYCENLSSLKKGWHSRYFMIEQCAPFEWYFTAIQRGDSATMSLHCSSACLSAKITKCTLVHEWSTSGRLITGVKEYRREDFEAVASIEFPVSPQPSFDHILRNGMMHNSISCEFEITVPDEIINVIHGPTLLEDMRSALENEINTDVILQTANKTLKAHKAILSARSSVFAAMFESDMREKAENIVEITDVDGEVLEELLKFIYTDEIPKLNSMAINLLVAADKYNVKGLKARCEDYLCKNINIETAAENLIVADCHNFGDLKRKLLVFINLHKKAFMKTDKYHKLRTSHVHLFVDIFEAGL